MARSSSGESVIQRVVRILEQFGPNTAELNLTTLARRARLPIATAHRLVEELAHYGLLQRSDDRTVRIGRRLSEICCADMSQSLQEVAEPFMQDLHEVVGHQVCLGVLDGRDVVFLQHFGDSSHPHPGRMPAYANPCGLVLLANLPRSRRDKALRDVPDSPTKTAVEPRKLRQTLAAIRRTGHAIIPRCPDLDGTGIAVPIRNGSSEVIGALSLTVPVDCRAQRLIPALETAARGISRNEGAHVRG